MKGQEILKSLPRIPEETEFPGADGVIIRDNQRIRLLKDGRIHQYHYQFKRILKDFERDKHSDIQMLFNEKTQDIKILSVKSIMRDGRIVETPEYGINQITPPALSQAPYFTFLQNRIASLVGVETGGYIEVEYEIVDKKPWRKAFWGTIPIRLYAPVLSREIAFELPRKHPVQFQITGSGKFRKPEDKVEGNIRRLRFTFDNLPLWDSEDRHPLADLDCPKLVYSDIPRENLHRQFDGLLTEASTTEPFLNKRVDDLVKDIDCPMRKAFRLHKHVLESVSTLEFPPLNALFLLRSAPEVLRSGYGSALEKNILLAVMLRHIGHQAEVVLSCPEGVLPDRAAHLGLFDRSWVKDDTLELFFSADKDPAEAQRAHLERTVILHGDKSSESPVVIDSPGSKQGNVLIVKGKFSLKKEMTLKGTLEALFSGLYNCYFALATSETDDVKTWINQFAGKVCPSAEVEKHHFRMFGPAYSELSASFEVKLMQEDPEHRILLTMPAPLGGLGGFNIPADYTRRSSTYALPGTLRHDLKLEIDCPPEIKIIHTPGDVAIENSAGRLEQKFEVKTESRQSRITFTQLLVLPEKYIRPGEYSDLLDILLEDARPHNRMMILAKK
ncbi:DUF3857 domain-containing protein [bacterium]|nr:DUF3857 domain-containing protein [candidate division CSSED10-310 bacterium]